MRQCSGYYSRRRYPLAASSYLFRFFLVVHGLGYSSRGMGNYHLFSIGASRALRIPRKLATLSESAKPEVREIVYRWDCWSIPLGLSYEATNISPTIRLRLSMRCFVSRVTHNTKRKPERFRALCSLCRSQCLLSQWTDDPRIGTRAFESSPLSR